MPELADLLAAEAHRHEAEVAPDFSAVTGRWRRRRPRRRVLAAAGSAALVLAVVGIAVAAQPGRRDVLRPVAPSPTATPTPGVLTGAQAAAIVDSPTTEEAVRRARELGFDPQVSDLRTYKVVVPPQHEADLWLHVLDDRVVFLVDQRYRDQADTPGRAVTDEEVADLVGRPIAEVIGWALDERVQLRLYQVDDRRFNVTLDLRPNRVDLVVQNRVVTEASRG